MGFLPTASTISLTAKLTPLGRKKLISTNNLLITKFAFGDSDANYYSPLTLATGKIPTAGGNIGSDSGTTNSVFTNVGIKSPIIASASGSLFKIVEPQSITINNQFISLGQTIVSASSLTQVLINRNSGATDSLVNLFYSFGLGLNTADDIIYTGRSFSNGGYADTALSGLSNYRIAVIAIPNANYGEILDGKQIKLSITTTGAGANTYAIYSTFQKTSIDSAIQDANYTDASANIAQFGNNVALLFTDDLQKPNNDSTLSWATGFGTVKPFSVNNKQFFNLTNTSQLSLEADKAIGIAYLDKGFLIITDPSFISGFNPASTSTTVTYNSVSTKVSQNIICIANKGEFATSTNKTFTSGSDSIRISEVGLYDKDNNLIAIAKTDRHITKNINQALMLSVSIDL